MRTVTILYFASLHERIGLDTEQMQLPDACDESTIRQLLQVHHPCVQGLLHACRFSLDENFLSPQDSVPIPAGALIGVIPPVSGG